MEHLKEMIYQNLLRLKELDQVTIEIKILTGCDLFELMDRFAAGWLLTPPDDLMPRGLVNELEKSKNKISSRKEAITFYKNECIGR